MKQYLLLVCAALLSVGCSTLTRPEKALSTSHRPHGFVLVREYVDSVKSGSEDVYQKVQYGWDYDKGMAVERIYSMQDALIREEDQPTLTLETTSAELDYAFDLVRQHPALKKICSRADARFYGGFSLRENDPTKQKADHAARCAAKSRCIHIIVSGGPNGEEPLAHAIVDLMLGSVVDPSYEGEKSL